MRSCKNILSPYYCRLVPCPKSYQLALDNFEPSNISFDRLKLQLAAFSRWWKWVKMHGNHLWRKLTQILNCESPSHLTLFPWMHKPGDLIWKSILLKNCYRIQQIDQLSLWEALPFNNVRLLPISENRLLNQIRKIYMIFNRRICDCATMIPFDSIGFVFNGRSMHAECHELCDASFSFSSNQLS